MTLSRCVIDETANQLVSLWRRFTSQPGAVYLDKLYLDLLGKVADAAVGAAGDVGIWTLITKLAMNMIAPGSVMNMIAPGSVLIDDAAGIAAGLVASETSDLSDHVRRLLNLVTMVHSVHSMEPLRRRLADEVRPQIIAANKMRMRLGISDAKTGCFFSVTEPFADPDAANFDDLVKYGLLDLPWRLGSR